MTNGDDVTRREVVKMAGAAGVAAAAAVTIDGFPRIQKVRAANEQVQFGMIGTGSRGGNYLLLKHLVNMDSCRCVALCDIRQEQLDKVKDIPSKPKTFKDYRELLALKDVDAVLVTTPLFEHFRMTRDALLAGKHVFCEKCLVFKPEEVHALRALVKDHPKQVLQTGLQRRYSQFYQIVKNMVDKGVLGDVKHIHAQWHRNMINKPSSLWTMKPGGRDNIANWRVYRQFSGGLTAELMSHQVDVSDWMFGSSPEFVQGHGSLETLKDGRDIFDNIDLIFRYPKGQKLTYSSISTNQQLPYFNGSRTEMGECIMGTDGTIQITVGEDEHHAIAWWYREPPKETKVTKAGDKKDTALAGATMVSAGGSKPVPLMLDDINVTGKESFLDREAKFARRWLFAKGLMVQEERKNPVDTELESFFQSCKDLQKPKADLEVGLADSIAVMLSNQAMDENRRVYFSEIEKMGTAAAAPVKKG
jgi:predicted dehydrogenase